MSRIALVSSSFAPYRGGVEEHVRHTAAALTARGHEVVIWTVDRGEHLGVGTVDGITVRYLPTPLHAARVGSLTRFARQVPGAWRAWRAAARQDRPSLLHVHCFGPNGLYAVTLAQRLGLPLVVTSHGETFMDAAVFADSALLRAGLRRALRRASAVTGVSEAVLTDLRGRFGLAHGSVIANGVPALVTGRTGLHEGAHESAHDGAHDGPPAAFAEGTGPVGGGQTPTIFAVGRLEPVKGFDVLLAALPRVLAFVPDARVRLGGSGSASGSLADQIGRLGLTDSVTPLGPLTGDQVAVGMASADVVVVPSRREAFGIVILEAWRAGTPVVASRVDGIAGLVEDGVTGLLVPPGDAPALAQACVRVLTDPALATALSAAGSVAVQSFSWDSVAQAYARIYSEVLG